MGYTAKMQDVWCFQKVFLNIKNKYFGFLIFFYNGRQYKVFTDIVYINTVNNT